MCLCTGMLAPSKEETMAFDLSHQILQQQKAKAAIRNSSIGKEFKTVKFAL
jgi:hypothetical protein